MKDPFLRFQGLFDFFSVLPSAEERDETDDHRDHPGETPFHGQMRWRAGVRLNLPFISLPFRDLLNVALLVPYFPIFLSDSISRICLAAPLFPDISFVQPMILRLAFP